MIMVAVRYTLKKILKRWVIYNSFKTHPRWISAAQLGLYGQLVAEWTEYFRGLQKGAITLSISLDCICWSFNTVSGEISAKKAYQQLMENFYGRREWLYSLWKWKVPHRVKVCCWFALEN